MLRLDPVQIAYEMRRLIPEVQTRRRKGRAAQARTRLAILIHEAHLTSGPSPWGQSLGQYLVDLGFERDRFEKYKSAGKALLQHKPLLYERFLMAIRDGVRFPELPEVSKLAKLPSVLKQVDIDDGTADLTLERTARIEKTRMLLDAQNYAGTDSAGKRTLQAFDAFKMQAGRFEPVLESVIANKAGVIPEASMHRKAGALLRRVQAVVTMLAEIYDVTSEGHREGDGG